jgi:hypothetical protein
MNNDGVPDYAITVYDGMNPYNQWVEVRSGADHSVIWTVHSPPTLASYGWFNAGELDVNGDGHKDLIVTAETLTPHGTVIVYDNSGVELYRIVDPYPNLIIGRGVAALKGDIDGDGCGDFLIGAADTLNRGAVLLVSGRTGTILRVSYGEQIGDKIEYCTGCGDLDGDGVPDYAGGGNFAAAVVTAFSGATGQIIHSWRDPNACCMGIDLISGFDLDQDGVNDLAAGAFDYSANAMSGRDGTFLKTWYNSIAPSTSCIGESMTMCNPPPGERYPLIIFAESCWYRPGGFALTPPGVIYAYRGCPKGVRAYGQPNESPGQQPPLSGVRNPTTPLVRFTLSHAAPSALAVLALGGSDQIFQNNPLPLQLAPIGFPGITLLTSSDVLVFQLAGSTGMSAGYASFDLQLPPNRVLDTSGTPLFAQWLWLDPNNVTNHGSTAGQRFLVR